MPSSKRLEDRYVSSFWSFTARAFYVFNVLSFTESMRVSLEVVDVNKEVFAAVARRNESETFLCIEKFYCTFRFNHFLFLVYCLYA